jgi:hypothetical protein
MPFWLFALVIASTLLISAAEIRGVARCIYAPANRLKIFR